MLNNKTNINVMRTINKTKQCFLISIFIALIGLQVNAQQAAVKKLFDKYSEQEGFTVVHVSGEMIALMAESNESDEEMQDALEGINGIMILTVEDEELNKTINFYKEIGDKIPWDEYIEIMNIKTSDMRMKMVVRKAEGKVSEFLMLGGGDDNFLISIMGNVNLNNISKIEDIIDAQIDSATEEL